MTKITDRNSGRIANVPLPKPRPQSAPAAAEQDPAGWTAPASGATQPKKEQGSFIPIDAEKQSAAAMDAIKQLAPMGVTGVDPLQALDGVKDGKATITIPLNPGHYKPEGMPVGFNVMPGTVATITVDVKDGKIMPVYDAHGRPTGRGTQVKVNPPLDLPLWLTGRGAYVQDKGGAQEAFKADIGGFFDMKIADMKSNKLADVVKGFAGDSQPSKAKKGSAMPEGMLNTNGVQFNAQVSMANNLVKAGSAQIDLAPGTQVHVSGNGHRATLDGQLNINGATINQDGNKIALGPGSAHLHADYSGDLNGTMHVTTQISNVNATIKQASLDKPKTAKDPNPDHLDIANTTLRNGSLTMDATFTAKKGQKLPALTKSTVHMKGDAEGSLIGAKLSVPNTTGGKSKLELGPAHFKGTLDLSPGADKVNLDITGARADVTDLKGAKNGSSIGIQHAHIEGDLHLQTDAKKHDFNFSAKATKLDVKVNGYKGHGNGDNIDFKSLDISGPGTLKLSNKGGITVDGDLKVHAEVNDLNIRDRAGRGNLDLTQGTTLDGTTTHFKGGGQGQNDVELKAHATVNAKVKDMKVKAGGVDTEGVGTLTGTADINLGAKGAASLELKDTTARLVLTKNTKLGSEEGALGLDVAKGSAIKLNIQDAKYGGTVKKADTESIHLGPGSEILGTLDGGHVTVQGKRIDLDKGSTARFDISDMSAAKGENPVLKGKLMLDASVRSDQITDLQAGGIKVSTPGGTAAGHVHLTVPDVEMSGDGKVKYNNAHVSLDAKVGNLRPGEVAPNAPIAPATVEPTGLLTPDQVKAESVEQIAGAAAIDRTKSPDPMEMAKRLQNGTLDLEIPVEGRIRKNFIEDVAFDKGTTMKLQLKVKDGKIVPDETQVNFSHPGDLPLWFTLKGAHFDKDNTLRLQMGGTLGYELPIFKHMPMEVGPFIDTLTGKNKGKSTNGAPPAGIEDAFKVNQARLDITDAQFKPGPLNLPGGSIDIAENTKLSLHGGLQDATLSGHVGLNGVDIAHDGLALKGGAGGADLNINWKNGVATTTLEHLSVDTQYAVEKRENGDYIKLAQGHIDDAKLSLAVPIDVAKLKAGNLPVPDPKALAASATLDVPRFSGTVDGARMTSIDAQGRATTLEMGHAQIDGEVHVAPGAIQVKGNVTGADMAVRNLHAQQKDGTLDVEYGRMIGSGSLAFDSKAGIDVQADVASMDMQAVNAEAKLRDAEAQAPRTRITGHGHVGFSTEKGLSLEGELHVDSDLSGELTLPKVQLPAPQPAQIEVQAVSAPAQAPAQAPARPARPAAKPAHPAARAVAHPAPKAPARAPVRRVTIARPPAEDTATV